MATRAQHGTLDRNAGNPVGGDRRFKRLNTIYPQVSKITRVQHGRPMARAIDCETSKLLVTLVFSLVM